MPCLVCRYDLRGMSVRTVCPECGTPVRATILATVDPYAGVLRPLSLPRLTAAGLTLWTWAALAAALLTWAIRAADAYTVFAGGPALRLSGVAVAAAVCVAVSGVGALTLIRPHAGIPRRQVLAAAGGALCMFLLAGLHWRLHAGFDMSHLAPYIAGDRSSVARTEIRLLMDATMLAVILGLRPNARLLAARSLLLRMGRVDRQTMLAMVGALGVAALGDLMQLVAAWVVSGDGVVRIVGISGDALIAVGSMLLTVGLISMAVDCWRIAPVLLRPPLAMGQVVGEEGGA